MKGTVPVYSTYVCILPYVDCGYAFTCDRLIISVTVSAYGIESFIILGGGRVYCISTIKIYSV